MAESNLMDTLQGAADEDHAEEGRCSAPAERLRLAEAVCPPETRRCILRWWRQLRAHDGNARSEELRQLRAQRDREYDEKLPALEQQIRERRQKVDDWANDRLETLLRERRDEAESARRQVQDLNRDFEARQAEILSESGLDASQLDDALPKDIETRFSEVKEILMAKVPDIIAKRDQSFALIKDKASHIRSRHQAALQQIEQRPAALKSDIEAAFRKRVAEVEAKYANAQISEVPVELLGNVAKEVKESHVDLEAIVEGLQSLPHAPAELVRAAQGVAHAVRSNSSSGSVGARPDGCGSDTLAIGDAATQGGNSWSNWQSS